MDIFDRIAERKLAEAIERGEFDDFEGKGEPLELEDLSGLSEELRAGYILLKGHGLLPDEAQLRKDLVTIEGLLRACTDEGARKQLLQRRSHASVQLALFLERRGTSAAFSEYSDRIAEKLAPPAAGSSSPDSESRGSS